VTVENCGHVPQVECPEQTNELLMDFFARAQPFAGAGAFSQLRADAEAA
jgi:hypothetical protein